MINNTDVRIEATESILEQIDGGESGCLSGILNKQV